MDDETDPMSSDPCRATNAFLEELESLLSRFCQEWSLSHAAAIGCLEIQKHSLLIQMFDDEGDDD